MRSAETIGSVWRGVQRRLEALEGVDPAPREGRMLVAHVLGMEERELTRQEADPFPALLRQGLDGLVARRLRGEPLAYVLGIAPFWGRDWKVTADVLIPRPDSEILVREALEACRLRREELDAVGEYGARPLQVAEVGVGSGCLLGSLLLARPDVVAIGTDISSGALHVAQQNIRDAGVADRCRLMETDMLAGVGPLNFPGEGRFLARPEAPETAIAAPMIISRAPQAAPSPRGPVGPRPSSSAFIDVLMSNPPYIPLEEWRQLEPCVRDFEPRSALVGGTDGLDFYRKLVENGLEVVPLGGFLCVEIGWQQGPAVLGLFERAGWQELRLVKDLGGRNRVVTGRRG